MNDPRTQDVVFKTMSVRCTVETAFRTWTEEIHQWWPAGHSRSGEPDTTVILEPGAGGRLFERTSSGLEYEWGEVTLWEPPDRLCFDWYLGSGPDEPSRVEVRFVAIADDATQIEILHRGPEYIGALWTRNQSVYAAGWDAVLAAWQAFHFFSQSPDR